MTSFLLVMTCIASAFVPVLLPAICTDPIALSGGASVQEFDKDSISTSATLPDNGVEDITGGAHPAISKVNIYVRGTTVTGAISTVHVDQDNDDLFELIGDRYPVAQQTLAFTRDLTIEIDVGSWKKDTWLEAAKDIGGSWVTICRQGISYLPSNTNQFSSAPGYVWSSSIDSNGGDHAYTLTGDDFNSEFDGHYGTNPADTTLYGTYYLHVYLYLEGGTLTNRARRVAVIQLLFQDQKTINFPSFTLEKIPGRTTNFYTDYEYKTTGIPLGGQFHSVFFTNLQVGNGYTVTVKDGTTVFGGIDSVPLQGNPLYFDLPGVSPRIHAPEEGWNVVQLKTSMPAIQRTVIHEDHAHVFQFFLPENSGTSFIIPEGTVLYLGELVDDDYNFMTPRQTGGEGFTIQPGNPPGDPTQDISSLVPTIENVYDVTKEFNGGRIEFMTVGDNNRIAARAVFTSAINAPFLFQIRFDRKLESTSDVSYVGLAPRLSEASGIVEIQWNNLPSLIPLKKSASFLTSEFQNPDELHFKIETLDETDEVEILPNPFFTQTNINTKKTFGTFRVWNFLSEPKLFASFDITRAPPAKTLFQFKLTLAYGTTSSEGRKYNTDGSVITNLDVQEIEYVLYLDTTVTRPSGSFGTVSFLSDDLVVTSGEIKDPDGDFFLQAGVSGWSLTNGYVINTYFVPTGTSQLDPSVTPTPSRTLLYNFTGGFLTVSSLQLFGLAPGTGIYQFTIQPYYWEPGKTVEEIAYGTEIYGDVISENAANAPTGGWLKITVIALRNPQLKFSKDGTVENSFVQNAITSQTGIVDIIVPNLNDATRQYLVPGEEVVLEQFVGGIKRHEIRGFDDTVWNAFRLYDDPLLFGTRIYAPGAVNFRFLDLQAGDVDNSGNPIGIGDTMGTIRGISDGTYTYRGIFNYDGFDDQVSLNTISVTTQTRRSLTINEEPVSTTIYSNQFRMEWNPMTELPDDLVENGKVRYVVLFGKASDGATAGSFTSDLSAMPSNIHVLEQNGTDEFGSEVWNDRVFGQSETDILVDETFGDDGSPAFNVPDGTTETFYFAVMPLYKVIVDQDTNAPKSWWYHGDLSNVVELVINRQVFTLLNIAPSRREGRDRVVYSQDAVTFEAVGVTGGVTVADAANITITTWESTARETASNVYFADMTPAGSGRFEITIDVLDDLLLDKVIKPASVHVEFDYTTAGLGSGIPIDDFTIVFNTGIASSINFISPGQGGIIAPASTPSGELLFGVNVYTDPGLAAIYNLPTFAIEPGDVSIMSAIIAGHGDVASFGTIVNVAGTLNWRITLLDLFDISPGSITIDLVIRVTAGTLDLEVPASLTFTVRHDPSNAVISPTIVQGGQTTVPGYDPIDVRWLSFYGSNLLPDSVALVVTKNGQPYFAGTIPLTIYYYRYIINPLQHDSEDVFSFIISTKRGDKASSIAIFTIKLDFEVTITVDLGAFEYDSSDPEINGNVDAHVLVEYPVSYDLFYIETNQVIFNPEDYRIVRDLGNGTIILFIPEDLGTSTQLVFDMEGRPSSPGDVDKLVFDIPAPITTKQGFEFPEENKGTLYVENVTITSQYRFTNLNVMIVPSASFTPRPDEVWNVTVNGVQVTATLTPERYLNFQVDVINPGEVILVTIIHYNENDVIFPEEPEPEPELTLWQRIVAFFTAIITFILGLFGLARIRRKRLESLGDITI